MPDLVTQGALTGAASGASAGANFGPWGALAGGVIGGGLGAIGGMGSDRAARRARILRHLRESAQRHVASLERQANEQAQARLRQLSAERYGSYNTLANTLSSPERAAAGEAAGVDFQSRLGSAMGQVDATPVGDRSIYGGGASDVPINTQLDPLNNARRTLLRERAVQGGLQRYDTGALNTLNTTGIDISRRAQEEGQRQSLLAAIRSRMLAEAGAKYADKGPISGELNQQFLSRLGLAGMHLAGGLYANRGPTTGQMAAEQVDSMPPVVGGFTTTSGTPSYSYSPLGNETYVTARDVNDLTPEQIAAGWRTAPTR